MKADIIYRDKDLLVANKPHGLVVHPDARHKTGTMIQQIAEKHPEIKKVGNDPERPGLVHRLDKDTSGLLVVALNQNSFDYLRSLFPAGKIKKTYLTLVMGSVKKNGTIELPIGRSKKDSRRRLALNEQNRKPGKGISPKTRESRTEYKIKKRLNGFTLLEARPITGRTHQLRAHLAAIGHPIVCDRIYSGKRLTCPSGLTRQFLHAWKLEFVSPSGVRMTFEADLPDDLTRVLSELH